MNKNTFEQLCNYFEWELFHSHVYTYFSHLLRMLDYLGAGTT